MPVKTRVTIFQPDALAIVADKLNPKLQHGRHGDLVGYHRNLVKLEVPIGHGRRLEKRTHNAQGFRLRKCRMEDQIAAVFEIAEIQAQGTAISDGRPDRLFFVTLKRQPYVAGAPEAYAAIEFVYGFKFNVPCQFFCDDVNASPRRGCNRARAALCDEL